MNRGGIGSASIVLVFTVLCLAIFSVISLVPALTEQTLADSEVSLVKAYYEADALAEQILAEILASPGDIPENIMGVDIISRWDWNLIAERVSFAAPVSEIQELYVVVAIGEDSYEILAWRMQRTGEWEADDYLDVWMSAY